MSSSFAYAGAGPTNWAGQPRRTQLVGVALEVNGAVIDGWVDARVSRDLRDVSGSFYLRYFDQARIAGAVGAQGASVEVLQLAAGMPCAVKYQGATLLKGWIDTVDVHWEAGRLHAAITGRDAAGDLVDCAAAPNGPLEYRNQTALQIATAICKPFGIGVQADVDIGAPFKVFGINADETAMLAIERAARQRAMLVVSDGVGGLLLTRGGSSRAPTDLVVGTNVLSIDNRSSWLERFSDYFVKGQTVSSAYRSGIGCAVIPGLDPATSPVLPPGLDDTTTERRSVVMTGHAIDPQVTRWRPTVHGVRTQSGGASVQAQAEWALRVARGMSEGAHYTVLGWSADGALWRPNALVRVRDPYSAVDKDMLIASVDHTIGNHGLQTTIGVTGRSAFDRIDESPGRRIIFTRHTRHFGPTRQG